MNWSSEQNLIFHWSKTSEVAGVVYRNLVVEAYAGTGKTTTIKEAFRHAPERKILYAVFNKKNQKEAEGKIKDSRVKVRTLHSVGFSCIKEVWINARLDLHNEIEGERLNQVEMPPQFKSNFEFRGQVLKLVSFAKNLTINTTAQQLDEICGDRDLDPACIPYALKHLEISKQPDDEGRISFDDMVWLPCAMGITKATFDLVCIDEAQDMNLPQLTMAQQACRKGGRIVVVGDSRQAIYTFRGAVHNAMEMMEMTLRAKTLTLSTTYRCPQLVVQHAQKIVPEYKAAPTAPTGEVFWSNEASFLKSHAKIGDAILSRLNAPLMPMALQLLRANIPARIEGRDIGKQLVTMVDKMKATSVPNFFEKVTGWENKQVERLKKTKNPEKRIEQTHDIADTLRALAQDAKNVADINRRILDLFQDTGEGSKPAVILSTVHKAKGLEWHRVAILCSTFRNGRGDLEEDNIYYVAVTRAKNSLFFLSDAGAVERPNVGCASVTSSNSIPQKELDRIALEADQALKRAETIARENDIYMARGVRPNAPCSNHNNGETESSENMKKQKGKKVAANAKPAADNTIKNLFGFSPAAVARALGKRGATKAQAQAVLKGKASPITISVGWDSGNGGFYRGEPAPITDAQYKELMAGAPKAEKAADKKPATKRDTKPAAKAKTGKRNTTLKVKKPSAPRAPKADKKPAATTQPAADTCPPRPASNEPEATTQG